MQLTSANFLSMDSDVPFFFKATLAGIQKCFFVSNSELLDDFEEELPDLDLIVGYVVDSLFIEIREEIQSDLNHLDFPQQGFYTLEDEAIAKHRELVIQYIQGLNSSSLKTCPISVQ